MAPPPVAILCFHRVLPAARRDGPDAPYFERQTALSLDRFRALIDAIALRFAVISSDALCPSADGARWADRPSVVLTFDDGYADVLDVAAPELKGRGLPALLCVTTDVASGAQRGFPVDLWYAAVQAASVRTGSLDGLTGEAWSFDRARAEDRARFIDGPEKRAFVRAAPEEQRRMLERLRRALGVEAPPVTPPTLDVGGLVALVRDGWTLGSHGGRHALLPLLPAEDAARELVRSRAFFAAHGLPPPTIVAYPDGATCPRTEAQAREAGYTVGLALGSRLATREDPPLGLPRLIPTNDPGWFERRLLPLFAAAAR